MEGLVDKQPFQEVLQNLYLILCFPVAVWESVHPSCQQSTEAFQSSLLHFLSSLSLSSSSLSLYSSFPQTCLFPFAA